MWEAPPRRHGGDAGDAVSGGPDVDSVKYHMTPPINTDGNLLEFPFFCSILTQFDEGKET